MHVHDCVVRMFMSPLIDGLGHTNGSTAVLVLDHERGRFSEIP